MESLTLLNKKFVLTYMWHVFLLTLFLFGVFAYSIHERTLRLNTVYIKNINNIYVNDGLDASLMCYSTNCSIIELNGVSYISDEDTGILCASNIEHVSHEGFFNSLFLHKLDIDIGLTKIHLHFKDNDVKYDARRFIVIALMFFLWYGYIYFKNVKNELASNLLASKNIKNVLEGKLQYTVAGSMHHEMLGPITVVSDLFDEVQKMIGDSMPSGLCNTSCARARAAEKDREMVFLYMGQISTSIDRLHSVLSLLRESKNNRYSNGNKSIGDITVNLFATTSFFTARHFDYTIVGKELLNSLHLKTMPNGEFMNILANLITNSVEAQCNNIVLRARAISPGLLEILVEDNGTGILGLNNVIIAEKDYDQIFVSGVSSKDINGNIITDKSNWLIKAVRSVLAPPQYFDAGSSRGMGMTIIRDGLNNHNGRISISTTSKLGTTFRILIPVEPFIAT